MVHNLLSTSIGCMYYRQAIVSLLFAVCCFSAFSQQSAGMLILKIPPAKTVLKPAEFYVHSIADETKKQNAFSVLVEKEPEHVLNEVKATFRSGMAAEVQAYCDASVSQNRSLRPVIMRIKTFELNENSAGLDVRGSIRLVVTFDVKRGAGQSQLLEYTGGVRYTRNAANVAAVETALGNCLQRALTYFNTWINREADSNEKLAKRIAIRFTDYTKSDADTIYYSAERPLTWNDFRGKIYPSKFAAVVETSFGYDEEKVVKNGIITINITLKVYMTRSGSWAKSGSRNAYNLNHEQRHFDIARIIAARFKRKLTPENLPVDYYDGVISYEFIESLREMNRLQEKYDDETRHGIDVAAQQRWNTFIDAELKRIDPGKNKLTFR